MGSELHSAIGRALSRVIPHDEPPSIILDGCRHQDPPGPSQHSFCDSGVHLPQAGTTAQQLTK